MMYYGAAVWARSAPSLANLFMEEQDSAVMNI